MGQINIHNYEAYLLDFSEGNLTDELQMELELFLIQHPELDINLSDLALLYVEEEAASFSNKTNLKKSEIDLVSEEQFIAYIEHQLSADEKIIVEKSCSVNPSLANELALYQKTIAVADTTIIYQNKNELKRKPKVIWFDFSITQYAAAACILFLIGIFIFWPKDDSINNSALASNSKNNSAQNSIIKNENKTPLNKEQLAHKDVVKETISVIQKSNSITSTAKSTNTLLANNNQHTISKKDSIVDSPEIQELTNVSNETVVAINTPSTAKKQNSTVVQVITENDDDNVAANPDKKKKGIWAAASRALKNLNNAGVKAVNGNEDDAKGESSYALTLGGVSITHKAGL
jgi:hypothetical protein